ncbi:hypothetical protein P8452_32488 [Trifolium repens]|nr:hypothetical protein P8452_32488 [Trifolium repens]
MTLIYFSLEEDPKKQANSNKFKLIFQFLFSLHMVVIRLKDSSRSYEILYFIPNNPSNPTPTTDRETPTTDRERLINKLQCKGFLWVTILKLVVTLEGKNEELYLLSFP